MLRATAFFNLHFIIKERLTNSILLVCRKFRLHFRINIIFIQVNLTKTGLFYEFVFIIYIFLSILSTLYYVDINTWEYTLRSWFSSRHWISWTTNLKGHVFSRFNFTRIIKQATFATKSFTLKAGHISKSKGGARCAFDPSFAENYV